MLKESVTVAQHSVDTGATTAGEGLRSNVLSARHVAITSLAGAGPAASVALVLPLMAGFAGEAIVFAFVLTLIVALLLTNTFSEFSRRIDSAGSLFAWNSAGLGSGFGFVFAWFFVGCYLLITAEGFSVFGGFVHDYLRANVSVDIPWWVFTAFAVVYVVSFAWRGIALSVEGALVLLAVELVVILGLALWLLASGDAHLRLSPFDPGNSPTGWSGIGLALSFGMLSLIGYEGAASLAEEAQDAKRSVGRGLYLAAGFLSVFFIVVTWVLISSYGPIDKFAADTNAVQTLATREWHSFGGIVTLVVISSVLAFTQTAFNAGARVIFSLGRAGVLPPSLRAVARTHPRFGTPSVAIVCFAAVSVVTGVVLAAIKGPLTVFAYYGFMVSIAFLVVYGLTNVALVRYIRLNAPGELSLPRHVVMPAAALIGVGYALYRTVHPLPPSPLNVLPWVVAAWAGVGVALLIYLRASGKADVDEVARAFTAAE
jgi:amino acid transporter